MKATIYITSLHKSQYCVVKFPMKKASFACLPSKKLSLLQTA